jgi:hypothetical protein
MLSYEKHYRAEHKAIFLYISIFYFYIEEDKRKKKRNNSLIYDH